MTERARTWRKWWAVPVLMAWLSNLALLLAATIWVTCDGRSPATLDALWEVLGSTGPSAGSYFSVANMMRLAVGIAALSMCGILAGLALGPIRYRSLPAWLLATGLIGCWSALLVSWSTLYWEGQRIRLSRCLPQFETLVHTLQVNWPQHDGQTPELGYFLAYPKGDPRILMLLGSAKNPETDITIAAIEKTEDGTLVFELAGSETGAWLEWNGTNTAPNSFVGGLGSRYRVTRWSSLSPNWRLVRYAVSYAHGSEQPSTSSIRSNVWIDRRQVVVSTVAISCPE